MKNRAFMTNTTKRTLRVLLAEDSPECQLLTRSLLQKLGCETLVAAHGIEALHRLMSEPFELALMDCEMPEMSGLEVTCEYRAREHIQDRRLPIVALTGHTQMEFIQRCMAAGMDGFLPKPVTWDDLLEVLGKWAPWHIKPQAEVTLSQFELEPRGIDIRQALQIVGGDRALMEAVLQTFLRDTPVTLRRMREELCRQDRVELQCRAHGLKGAAASVGARRFRFLAQQAEQAALSAQYAQLALALEEMTNELRQIRAQFERELVLL